MSHFLTSHAVTSMVIAHLNVISNFTSSNAEFFLITIAFFVLDHCKAPPPTHTHHHHLHIWIKNFPSFLLKLRLEGHLLLLLPHLPHPLFNLIPLPDQRLTRRMLLYLPFCNCFSTQTNSCSFTQTSSCLASISASCAFQTPHNSDCATSSTV